MGNPLEKLALDHWYKVLMAGGFTVFLLVGGGLLPMLPVKPALFISLGTFFFGLGEWRNHPLHTLIDGRFQVTGYPRNPHLIGMIFDVIGLGLIAFGIWHLAG